MHRRPRKLGRAAESAQLRIERAPEHGEAAVEDARIDASAARAPVPPPTLLATAPPRRAPIRRSFRGRSATPSAICVSTDAKPGLPVAIFRREIRAAEKRLQLRREPYRHRPSAAAGRRLDECHVDAVDIRPLLAIHLDGDEIAIQQFGDLLVLERFALHHVAPMASRIADGKKDRLVLRPRLFERLRPPREPIHRIVRVLQQIRTLFVSETIHK